MFPECNSKKKPVSMLRHALRLKDLSGQQGDPMNFDGIAPRPLLPVSSLLIWLAGPFRYLPGSYNRSQQWPSNVAVDKLGDWSSQNEILGEETLETADSRGTLFEVTPIWSHYVSRSLCIHILDACSIALDQASTVKRLENSPRRRAKTLTKLITEAVSNFLVTSQVSISAPARS